MVMNIFLKYYISFVIFWTVFCAYTSHKQLSRQQSEGQIGRALRAAHPYEPASRLIPNSLT